VDVHERNQRAGRVRHFAGDVCTTRYQLSMQKAIVPPRYADRPWTGAREYCNRRRWEL